MFRSSGRRGAVILVRCIENKGRAWVARVYGELFSFLFCSLNDVSWEEPSDHAPSQKRPPKNRTGMDYCSIFTDRSASKTESAFLFSHRHDSRFRSAPQPEQSPWQCGWHNGFCGSARKICSATMRSISMVTSRRYRTPYPGPEHGDQSLLECLRTVVVEGPGIYPRQALQQKVANNGCKQGALMFAGDH